MKEELEELQKIQIQEADKLGEIREDYAALKNEEGPRHERLVRTCKQLNALRKKISKQDLEKPEVI